MMKLTIVVLCTFACAFAGVISNDWRIVGGQEADDGQFPYQISLRNEGYHSCGGSILDENTILTAAHCVDGSNPSILTVIVGTNHISEGGVAHQVREIRAHENYNEATLQNDVAILKLETAIEFNDKVQPIELEDSVIGGDETVTLSGWGTNSFPKIEFSSQLQFIKLVSLSVDKCQELKTKLPVVDSQICTWTKGGEGACFGDLGSPLVSAATGHQVGIVTLATCGIGYPDVYTRVSSFLNWIGANSK